MPEYEKVEGEEPAAVLDWKQDNVKEEKVSGGIITLLDGKIEGYELDKVLRNGFFRVRAPVFSDPFVKWQTLFVVLMVWLIAGLFIGLHKSKVMLVDGNLVGQAAAIFGYFGGLSGFLFGFFVFNNLAGFMNLKNNQVGGYWGAFANLSLCTGTWFPGTDSKTKLFKLTIVRWGVASFNLMCFALDSDTTTEEGIAKCVARGLLTKDEAEAMTACGGMPTAPIAWILSLYEEACVGLPGSDFKVNKVEMICCAMRAGMGGAMCSATSWGQIPLPLVHLMSALVKLQLFLLSVSEGVHTANIIVGDAPGKFPQILFSTLMVVCTPIIFQGLLEFVIMISNPFGKDWVDFPIQAFHMWMRDEMFRFINMAEVAPGLQSVKEIKGLKKK